MSPPRNGSRNRHAAAKPPPRGPAGTLVRVSRAWRLLESDQRIAAAGSVALLISMFLPWYEKSCFVRAGGALQAAKDSVSAFGAFSFVEAAVLLVAAALTFLLYARAERRAFHLPFGDGPIIAAGGAWVALLIVIRFFDKPGAGGGCGAATVGIQWGAFVALAAAAAIAYAGWRIRMAGRPEPENHRWEVEPAALEFEPVPARRSPRPSGGDVLPPLPPQDSPTERLPPDPATERIAPGGRLAPLPDLHTPPEFGATAKPDPDVDPPTPVTQPQPIEPAPTPSRRRGRRPRAPRPPAGDDADRLF
jgi:hypothetical protein